MRVEDDRLHARVFTCYSREINQAMSPTEFSISGRRSVPFASPNEVREEVARLEQAMDQYPLHSKEWRGAREISEALRARLGYLKDLVENQSDLKKRYPGPWNLAATSTGRALLVEADPAALVAQIQIGKPLAMRILGHGLEDKPAAVRLAGSSPMLSEWVYPRLEGALDQGRALRMEPPPLMPPKTQRRP